MLFRGMDGGDGEPTAEGDHAVAPVKELSDNTVETREDMLSRHRFVSLTPFLF